MVSTHIMDLSCKHYNMHCTCSTMIISNFCHKIDQRECEYQQRTIDMTYTGPCHGNEVDVASTCVCNTVGVARPHVYAHDTHHTQQNIVSMHSNSCIFCIHVLFWQQ